MKRNATRAASIAAALLLPLILQTLFLLTLLGSGTMDPFTSEQLVYGSWLVSPVVGALFLLPVLQRRNLPIILLYFPVMLLAIVLVPPFILSSMGISLK